MDITITQLDQDQPIPYELLLLADPSRRVIDSYIHRGTCYAASDQTDIVGVYVLLSTNANTMEIMNIAVKEEVQGRGIGTKLLYHAIAEAKRLGASILEIGTGNSSVKQLRLYQACGFRITAVDKGYFVRHYEDEIYEDGIPCRDMIRLSMELEGV